MEFKESKGLEAYAKLFAVLVAVVPVICLVLSLFYDWGMFRAAGISFSSAPTSIADHFRTTLVWMPYVVILSVFIGFLYLYHKSRKTTETGTEGSRPLYVPIAIRKSDLISLILALVLFVLWILTWLALGSTRFPMGETIFWMSVCFFFVVWLALNETLNRRYGRLNLQRLAACTLLIVVFYSLGYNVASRALEIADPEQRIHILRGDTISEQDVIIVRSFGEWMLAVTKPEPQPNDFLWIRMDKIERIEILNDTRFQGLFYWISKLLSRNES